MPGDCGTGAPVQQVHSPTIPAVVGDGSTVTDAFADRICVVTGGLGFIGSNLVHRLAQAGATVRVVDALVAQHGGDLRNIEGLDVELEVCEIGDPRMTTLLDGAHFVFNLAGQVSHSASMRDPLADLRYNTVSHAHLLEMLRDRCPSARVIHTSTRQVYGRATRDPVDETHPTRPVDINGVAKLAGEQLHMVYAHAHDMAITSLRLTNVYGPRQRLTSDELGFLPVFVRTALQGGTIELFGDGSQRRDCLYVGDVVDAIVAATDVRAIGRVFNVGNEVDHPLIDIARAIIDAAGGDAQLRCKEWPAAQQRIDIGSFHSDSSALLGAVGWRATTSLADGMASTLTFYRGRPWYQS
jgi:UDP-glucose 4-epimerase